MLAFFSKTDEYFCPSFAEGQGHDMKDLHYHHSYELYLLDKGKRTYLIDDNLYEMNEGDIVLISPMKLHKTIGQHYYRRYLINFSDKFLNSYFTKEAKEFLLKCFTMKCVRLSGNRLQTIRYLFEKIIKSYDEKDKMSFVYLADILGILVECMNGFEPIKPLTSTTNKTILNIIEYINTHYQSINSISEIADQHYITKYHLCRLFKNATDVSLVKYINSVKIHKACHLLDNSNKNITEIAYETGFNSSMYFCKTFKSLMGMTPTEYKSQEHRKKKHCDDNILEIE